MGQPYEIVIGLEVHAELSTVSKIFCDCATTFGAKSNTQICPVCLGLPGTLPVLNKEVMSLAIRTGLALNCQIARQSKFDRKNYFYPDLPKAYQISQFDMPIAEHGYLMIDVEAGNKKIGITRVHMEEDAGKLVHLSEGGQIGTALASLVDYNRTGVPLVEIVSEPDMRSSEEAYAYLTGLKEILQYADVSDCNMEEGSLRCDANISVRPIGQKELGTKAELKNMNSFKNIRLAIDYEAKRQIKLIEEGGSVVQETRLWDIDKGVTIAMRSKEEAHDYRYFPEPDLPLITVSEGMIQDIKNNIPELPQTKRQRFIEQFGLSDYDAGVLTGSKALAAFYEEALLTCQSAKNLSNWLTVELLGKLNAEGKSIEDSPIKPEQLAVLVEQIENGTISGKMGKQVFAEMIISGGDPAVIIKEKGLVQISDESAIEKIVVNVMAAHPGPVEEYRGGKEQTIGFLVGQVMKLSGGQANPKKVNQILREKLG